MSRGRTSTRFQENGPPRPFKPGGPERSVNRSGQLDSFKRLLLLKENHVIEIDVERSVWRSDRTRFGRVEIGEHSARLHSHSH